MFRLQFRQSKRQPLISQFCILNIKLEYMLSLPICKFPISVMKVKNFSYKSYINFYFYNELSPAIQTFLILYFPLFGLKLNWKFD